jgi:hypothetical protein
VAACKVDFLGAIADHPLVATAFSAFASLAMAAIRLITCDHGANFGSICPHPGVVSFGGIFEPDKPLHVDVWVPSHGKSIALPDHLGIKHLAIGHKQICKHSSVLSAWETSVARTFSKSQPDLATNGKERLGAR